MERRLLQPKIGILCMCARPFEYMCRSSRAGCSDVRRKSDRANVKRPEWRKRKQWNPPKTAAKRKHEFCAATEPSSKFERANAHEGSFQMVLVLTRCRELARKLGDY